MRCAQRVSNLDPHAERLLERKRALLEPLFERFSLQIFHDEEGDPILMAHVIQDTDVRV